MVDPDEALKATQKTRDNLDPELVRTAKEQSRRVKGFFEQLEAKGISREQIWALVDGAKAEQSTITPVEPSLSELSAKLDNVLDRLEKIESLLDG